MAAIALTSVMIDLFSRFVPAYHGDPILVALFAGLLEGLGLSLIFIRGATTGPAATWWPGCWAGGCPTFPWAS